ncbi:unnamed protein product [Symbiodinium sp. KB8]|nr:unnamed protein product [Symbiodinium sp. KB8]
MLYGPKEYLETLGNISHCAVDYVENAAACESDTTCVWKAMFESGVCFQTELLAVFTVIMPSLEDAIVKQVEIETLSLEATNEAIASAVASTGFSGALEVTGKTTMRVAKQFIHIDFPMLLSASLGLDYAT